MATKVGDRIRVGGGLMGWKRALRHGANDGGRVRHGKTGEEEGSRGWRVGLGRKRGKEKGEREGKEIKKIKEREVDWTDGFSPTLISDNFFLISFLFS